MPIPMEAALERERGPPVSQLLEAGPREGLGPHGLPSSHLQSIRGAGGWGSRREGGVWGGNENKHK